MSTIPKSSRYGLVTRTFIINLWAKCRKIFQSHGSYGITNRQKTIHSKAAQPRRQLVLGSWVLAKHMHMLFDNLTLTLCVCDLFLQIVFDVLYVLHIFCSGMGFKMREAFNKFFEMGSSSATAPPACLAKPGPLKWQMREGGSYETIYLEDYDIIIIIILCYLFWHRY